MIKLNIQRFSSTNKTTHYELSQYVSSDLPTYLVDYNSDMSKIDAGINSAQTTADTASTAATNAAAAAETAQTTANTAVTNAATADGKAETAQARIGTLANLTTTAKTDVVSAINEVDGNCDSNTAKIGTLTNLETTTKTNLVSAINELAEEVYVPVKLYENASGTNSNFVLNDNVSNYEKIEVFYGGSGSITSSEIYTARNLSIDLSYIAGDLTNSVLYIDNETITFSNTSATISNKTNTSISAGGIAVYVNVSALKIYEVIGYKRITHQ